MTLQHHLVIIICLFISGVVTVAAGSKNPCHPNKYQGGSCSKVVLPTGLCGACGIGEFDQNGEFIDCTRTMGLEVRDENNEFISNQQCLAALTTYVSNNPCDEPRATALENYVSGVDKEFARMTLDFFLYAMCEEACDCIPLNGAERDNPSYSLERGNCQAHAVYDVCATFPDVELIYRENSPHNISLPRACPLLEDWFNSPDSDGWYNKNVPIGEDVAYFLERLVDATGLTQDLSFWQGCFDLEQTQGRIDEGVPSSPGGVPETPTPANIPNDASIFRFVLVNADTNTDIRDLHDGDTIFIGISQPNVNVRADVTQSLPPNECSEPVGSVVFTINDQAFKTESACPYALAGDADRNYAAWSPVQGVYEIKATPYSGPFGQGSAGNSLSMTVTIYHLTRIYRLPRAGTAPTSVPTSASKGHWQGTRRINEIAPSFPAGKAATPSDASIHRFMLVNADTNIDIGELNDGDTIFIGNSLPNVNVRADVTDFSPPNECNDPVGSVVFTINGQAFKTESVCPYALAGDSDRNYAAWSPVEGVYEIKATPYSGSFGQGNAGNSLSVSITIVQETSANDPASAPAPASTSEGLWVEIDANAPIDPRHEACFVMVDNSVVGKKAYLVGGRGSKDLDIFDPISRSWTTGEQPPIEMHHMQCVEAQGLLWVMSAWTGPYPREKNAASVYVYDPAMDTWDERTAMPVERRRGAAAVVVSDDQTKIYVAQGNNGGHEVAGDDVDAEQRGYLDEYDILSDTWTQISSNAPNPRDHTCGGMINGKLCVASGRDGSVTGWPAVAETDCYNFVTQEWEVKASIPQPRSGASCGTTCDGKLIVAGGEGGGMAWSDVSLFDGETWTELAKLNVGRHGSGLAVDCVCNQIIIASGSAGQGGGPEVQSVEVFFPDGVQEDCVVETDEGGGLKFIDSPDAEPGDDRGHWGEVFNFTVIPIHVATLPDGNIFAYGASTEGEYYWSQGHYEVWHTDSDDHGIGENHIQYTYERKVNIFCATLSMDLTTGNILILGGLAGAAKIDGEYVAPIRPAGLNDVLEFDVGTREIRWDSRGNMKYGRYYGTSINLPDERIFVVGGTSYQIHKSVEVASIPEIWNPVSGFRELPGAEMLAMKKTHDEIANLEESWWYPHVYVNSKAEILVMIADEYDNEIYKVGVEGDGSIKKVGTRPFKGHKLAPSIMYDVDQVAVMDAADGKIWSWNISDADNPSITPKASLSTPRVNGVMTILPDGRVMINGGSGVSNGKDQGSYDSSLQNSVSFVEIWDPVTDTVIRGPEQDIPRLYHSSGLIMPDGSVFSAGGGAPGVLTSPNGQIYYPGYLFDKQSGNLVTRPTIETWPKNLASGKTFSITVSGDPLDIEKVTATKPGSMTHARNCDARWLDLAYSTDGTEIIVSLPGPNLAVAGVWHLNVIDKQGVPSPSRLFMLRKPEPEI